MLPENPAEKFELFQSYHLPAQNCGEGLMMVCEKWKSHFWWLNYHFRCLNLSANFLVQSPRWLLVNRHFLWLQLCCFVIPSHHISSKSSLMLVVQISMLVGQFNAVLAWWWHHNICISIDNNDHVIICCLNPQISPLLGQTQIPVIPNVKHVRLVGSTQIIIPVI